MEVDVLNVLWKCALTMMVMYYFVFSYKTWTEAQRYCRQNYTDLATIDNMEEMNSLINTVNGSYTYLAWIGLYNDLNTWKWSLEDDDFYQEGEKDFRNWYHEPDNLGGNELCVYMNNYGKWFDYSCDRTFQFVCYDGRQNSTKTYIQIANAKSWTEARNYCKEHYTDLVNVRNQTENQRIFDSVGGSSWIGLYRNRIWSNNQMTSYQTGDRKFLVHRRNQIMYHFVSESKTWSEAQRYCRENYTDLATTDNMEEMNRLIKTVRATYYGSAWIGLYDDLNSWRWSLNNAILEGGFKSWYVQQPINSGGQSLCVYMSYSEGLWRDSFCSIKRHFVCYDGRANANTRYVLVDQIKTWNEAQSYCREHYTDLVSIRNRFENYRSNSSFSNWKTEQPDNAGNSEYCTAVSFSDSGKWTDEKCSTILPFVCYRVRESRSVAQTGVYHVLRAVCFW
ncbi:C-type lectin domain family 10 member A [Labeo rohita]|uniref:C-type lectin domain family 10 member A n=1 Tax=Labeo rohita TaxID=84645 RepID=A0ABQ8MVB5_LABRO|nr:C-type lectin domain family 10 member A [Labeo rohita]